MGGPEQGSSALRHQLIHYEPLIVEQEPCHTYYEPLQVHYEVRPIYTVKRWQVIHGDDNTWVGPNKGLLHSGTNPFKMNCFKSTMNRIPFI